MQWVETTGKTIDEAKGLALDQLGVGEEDTEFEIIAEPRTGLFGRLKAEARVRARVRPTAVRPKVERRDRKKGRDQVDSNGADRGSDTVTDGRSDSSRGPRPQGQRQAGKRPKPPASGGAASHDRAATAPRPRNKPEQRHDAATEPQREEAAVSAQQVGEEAKKFLTELVTAFGLEGTVSLREDGDDLELAVSGTDLGLMVGPRGNTLLAVQDLTRVASQRRLGDHDTRLRVDVGGYRERRREALSRFAQQIAEQVVASGEARALEPMPSADRKVIHDVLTENTAVVTRSEGEDPNRRVVIAPANG
jgi:spoIIIJ-associated protein